jgi:capsular exopolysaccharide synthesis family protein
MSINGRSARLLRRYGPWTLVVTIATVAAAYGVNQWLPPSFESSASVLVEARVTDGVTPILPDLDTERAVALSDAVVLSAARRVGTGKDAMLDGFSVGIVPGSGVLTFEYSSGDRFRAQVRARALVGAYLDYREPDDSPVRADVTSPASAPAPQNRSLPLDLGAGLAAGLLLGAGSAMVRARTRGSIRSREDFERLFQGTVLATVPRRRRSSGLPVILRDPGSTAAESYRYLRTRLQPALRTTSATTVLVTSPGARQGRTTVAANLAVGLAQAGRDVVLVDADLRRPVLHEIFQTPGEHGLTTLLDGDATVSEVLEDTTVPRLRLLAAGHRTAEHVDLLEGPQLARVLRAVQKHCDVVVLDSAAVLSAPDAIALAEASDQVLLVGDFKRTSRVSVVRAMAELTEVVDGNVGGVLLNVPKSAGGLAVRVASGPLFDGQPHVRVVSGDAAPEMPDMHVAAEHQAVPVIYGMPVSSTVYSSLSAQSVSAPSVSAPSVSALEEASSAEGPESSPAEETDDAATEEDQNATAVLEARS